jgi:hypothetical protein
MVLSSHISSVTNGKSEWFNILLFLERKLSDK